MCVLAKFHLLLFTKSLQSIFQIQVKPELCMCQHILLSMFRTPYLLHSLCLNSHHSESQSKAAHFVNSYKSETDMPSLGHPTALCSPLYIIMYCMYCIIIIYFSFVSTIRPVNSWKTGTFSYTSLQKLEQTPEHR